LVSDTSIGRTLPQATALLGLAFAALLTDQARAVEPVFEVQQRPIPATLAPDRLPLTFYNFSPDEYWAEPKDSYWIRFSNWILIQERTQGPNPDFSSEGSARKEVAAESVIISSSYTKNQH
jgi:hypothetical protein